MSTFWTTGKNWHFSQLNVGLGRQEVSVSSSCNKYHIISSALAVYGKTLYRSGSYILA